MIWSVVSFIFANDLLIRTLILYDEIKVFDIFDSESCTN